MLFPDGGYAVLRDREGNWLLFEAGPHGALSGAHAHADALAIELAAQGRTLVADPGTGTYVSERSLRDQLRDTRSHATVTVQGQSSAVPAGPFRWQSRAEARITAWQQGQDFDFVAGEHDGFQRLDPPATVRREILFLHGKFWILRDEVDSPARPTFAAHFPLAQGVRVELDTCRATLLAPDGTGCVLVPSPPAVTLSLRESIRSSEFGAVEPAQVLDVTVPQGIGRLIMALVPFHPGTDSPEVQYDETGVRVRVGGRDHVISFGLGGGSLREAAGKLPISPDSRGA
jgi:hypothetical protein